MYVDIISIIIMRLSSNESFNERNEYRDGISKYVLKFFKALLYVFVHIGSVYDKNKRNSPVDILGILKMSQVFWIYFDLDCKTQSSSSVRPEGTESRSRLLDI